MLNYIWKNQLVFISVPRENEGRWWLKKYWWPWKSDSLSERKSQSSRLGAGRAVCWSASPMPSPHFRHGKMELEKGGPCLRSCGQLGTNPSKIKTPISESFLKAETTSQASVPKTWHRVGNQEMLLNKGAVFCPEARALPKNASSHRIMPQEWPTLNVSEFFCLFLSHFKHKKISQRKVINSHLSRPHPDSGGFLSEFLWE